MVWNILTLKKRRSPTFTNPVPPFMKMTLHAMRNMIGLPAFINIIPMKIPKALEPASPMSTWLGYALYHRYPARHPTRENVITAQVEASA